MCVREVAADHTLTTFQVDEALKIKNTDIAKELCLPPVKLHCSSKYGAELGELNSWTAGRAFGGTAEAAACSLNKLSARGAAKIGLQENLAYVQALVVNFHIDSIFWCLQRSENQK